MAVDVPRVPKSPDGGSPEAYDGLLTRIPKNRIGAMMDEHHRRMVGDIERLLEGQDGPPRSRQPGGPTGLGCAAGPAEAGAPPAASRSPPHGPDPGGGRPSRSDGAARSVAGKGGAAPLSASASWPRSPRGEQSAQPVALPPAPGAQQERLEPAEAARAAEALAEWRPGQRGGGGSVVFGGGGTFEVGAPVERLRDRLLEWTVVFSEHFEGRVYLRELVGQTLFGLLGPLGVPLLRVYYGTSEAIQNRQMTWPSKSSRTWQEYRALVLFASVGWLSGLSLCSALVIWFFWAPEGTSAAEIWLMCAAMFMMNNTRAIKYAHFPLASYRQFDTTLLRLDRVVSGLVLVSWLKPSQKTIDDFLDLSMLTVLGPVPRHTKLRFLRWPTTMHRAQTIAKRQGLSSRAIVCHALLRRQPAAAKCMHSQGSRLQAPDFALELPPGLAPTGAVEGPAECDGPSSHEVALEELFREIVEAAVRWEQKTLIGRAGPAVPLGALATAFLGCFGRLASGRPFFGAGWLTNLQVALVLLPTLLSGGPCVGFIFAGIRDMHRRLIIIRSLTALLSARSCDRRMWPPLPPEIRALGVLDLGDVETVEGFRELHGLCRDFGRSFSSRIVTFMNAFAAMTACMMAWVLVLVELKAYGLLDRTVLLICVYCVTVLGASVIGLALLGEGVNSASDRIVFLLRKHGTALHLEASRDPGRHRGDAGAPPGIAEFVLAVAGDVAAEKEASPVRLLGLYCGTSLISALYAFPVLWFSRLGNACADEPSLCTPDWYGS